MTTINYEFFVGMKGEFEAEGLSRDQLASEALFAAKNSLDYLVKIGGCEAKADISFIGFLGIHSVVVPMIETAFAMEKYMELLPSGIFDHVGVTIETVTAVQNIESILEAGTKLTGVTIGRTDLTASYKGTGVESEETIRMVKHVARLAKSKGLEVTMGGSINKNTVELVQKDRELLSLLNFIETRKAIMPIDQFVKPDALVEAMKLETFLLEKRIKEAELTLTAALDRRKSINSRI